MQRIYKTWLLKVSYLECHYNSYTETKICVNHHMLKKKKKKFSGCLINKGNEANPKMNTQINFKKISEVLFNACNTDDFVQSSQTYLEPCQTMIYV